MFGRKDPVVVVRKKIVKPQWVLEEEEAKRAQKAKRSEAAKLSWKKRKEADKKAAKAKKDADKADKKAAKAKKDAAAKRAKNKATKNVVKKIPAVKNTLSAIQQRQKMLDEATFE